MKRIFLTIIFAVLTISTAIFGQQPVVAVTPFNAISGITSEEANMMTRVFFIRLGNTQQVGLVDRAIVEQVIREHNFQASDWSNTAKTAELGSALNADWIVRGEMEKWGSNILVTVSFYDIRTFRFMGGADLRLANAADAYDQIDPLVNRLVEVISGSSTRPTPTPQAQNNSVTGTNTQSNVTDYFTWEVDSIGGVTITGYTGTALTIEIPAEIDGRAVRTIGKYAFQRKGLTSVTIPDSVRSIGVGAFAYNQLTSVSIPNGVTSIELGAFSDNKLTNITIPSSVNFIGTQAFQNNQLSSVTISHGVRTIGNNAFSSNLLTSVTIPNSVTSIGSYAFVHNQLTSITIPNSVYIAELAFTSNLLTRIIIGANVRLSDRSIGYGFERAYNNRAGTYTRSDTNSTNWRRQ